MEFKDLLVVVDESPSGAQRIDLAVQMASAFGAHLTGLCVSEAAELRPSVLAQFPPEVLDMLSRVGREDAARVKVVWDARLHAAAPASPPSGARSRARPARWRASTRVTRT
jgi:hypothetical protein